MILNNTGPTSTTPHHTRLMQSSTAVSSPTLPTPDTPSPRPCADTTPPDISSASRGEVGSVSAAVNTLNNIHEFALDLHNGNYSDTGYGGLQPVTDSLLSGSESRKSEDGSDKSDSAAPAPLLDFKSAFTDLENKNDMSFLHDSLDLSSDDLHRALTAPTTEQSKTNSSHQQQQQQQSTAHHNNSQQRSHQLHSMDYVSIESSQSHSSFDVNLDAFDILSDFPELSQYESGQPGHHSAHNPALINNSHPGPMLSQAATNSNSHIGRA